MRGRSFIPSTRSISNSTAGRPTNQRAVSTPKYWNTAANRGQSSRRQALENVVPQAAVHKVNVVRQQPSGYEVAKWRAPWRNGDLGSEIESPSALLAPLRYSSGIQKSYRKSASGFA